MIISNLPAKIFATKWDCALLMLFMSPYKWAVYHHRYYFNMKNLIYLVLFMCAVQVHDVKAQVILEAEDAVLDTDLSIGSSEAGYTGDGYVLNFSHPTDSVVFTYDALGTGKYYLKFKVNRDHQHQIEYVIDGGDKKRLTVPAGTGFRYSESVLVSLDAGRHSITFLGFWGYLKLDHLSITRYDPNPQIILEAENALIDSTLSINNRKEGYTGGGYVEYFPSSTDSVEFVCDIPEAGSYLLKFRTDRNGHHQIQYAIDDGAKQRLTVAGESGFRYSDSVLIDLDAGAHLITFYGFWGYLSLDHMILTKYTPTPYDYSQVTDKLVNHDKATEEAKDLYRYLRSNYGKKIISGYTGQSSGNQFQRATNTAGAASMIYNIDMNTLTRGYAYAWSNQLNTQIFGAVDNNQIDSAIAHHLAGHIISAQWHWYAPSGGHGPDQLTGARSEKAKTATFSASTTGYDITKAVDPQTEEYEWLIADIDEVAVHLKRLRDAGVPVLWRPFHEAAGGWFWWGTDQAAFVKAWDIMYDRLTNYHELGNLIWVLGQAYPEKNWLVSPDKYDIIGFDNYPGAYNYDAQATRIRLLREQAGHKKMVALTETGPIPDPSLSMAKDAMYSYFVGWANESLDKYNSAQHFLEVYSHQNVIVLGSDPDYR